LNNGRIIKVLGDAYFIVSGEQVFEGRAAGKFRIMDSAPRVGDLVTFLTEDKFAYITEILPRKNTIVRPTLANIDQMLIIVSAAPPCTDVRLIDKLCVLAASKGILPVICVNKTDIDRGDSYRAIYEKTPFKVIALSAVSGEGRDELLALLPDKLSMLVGNSGVGKSSILNMLLGEALMEIGEISKKIGRGRHTTRHIELLPFFGGLLADTPGFSSFDLFQMEIREHELLADCFPEFAPFLGQCRFNDCTHRQEPDCAILNAVKDGIISSSRQESYALFYDIVSKVNPWER